MHTFTQTYNTLLQLTFAYAFFYTWGEADIQYQTSKGVECDSTFIVFKSLYTSYTILLNKCARVSEICINSRIVRSSSTMSLYAKVFLKLVLIKDLTEKVLYTFLWRSIGPSSVKDSTACTDCEIHFSYTHTHTHTHTQSIIQNYGILYNKICMSYQ